MMAYEEALVAAGATVHQFKEFGSYQGVWFALATANGETGWIKGWYGSCSGCDSFQAEFGWDDRDHCDAHYSGHDPACKGCVDHKAKYDVRLAEFGKPYVVFIDRETLLKELDTDAEWDDQSKEAADWIRSFPSTSTTEQE